MPNRLLYVSSKRSRPGPAPAHAPVADSWAQLERRLRGRLLRPGEPDYPAARRVFNDAVQTRPAAIACCLGEADVRACLQHAAGTGVEFRIRGGGHNFAGYSVCDGLVIDVTGLDSVTMDGAGGIAVGGGCPQGSLGKLLEAAGLHLPLGDWPDVGVGGFMQGGGYGITARSFGMNLDHVESVRVMLADGRVVTADRGRNHDLWWAVRGGAGGNFGVVTQIAYRAHRDVRIASTALVWPLATAAGRDQAAHVLGVLQAQYASGGSADTNVTAMACFGLDPADRFMRGPWLIVSVDQRGSTHALNQAIAALRACPGAVADFDFARLKRGSDIPALRRQSRYIATPVPPAAWRAMLDLLDAAPGPLTTLYLQAQGGAINATPRADSAFIHRDADLLAYMDVFWRDREERDAGLAFQDRWTSMLQPYWNGRCYQNFADPALRDYHEAYWGDAFPALLAVKRKYDPDELFRSPQMIAGAKHHAAPVWPPLVVDALSQAIQR